MADMKDLHHVTLQISSVKNHVAFNLNTCFWALQAL